MTNVEPSFVLYALLLHPGCCLRAHIILIELVEPEGKKKVLKIMHLGALPQQSLGQQDMA